MKEHQQEHKHKRFYIYRHVKGEQVKYIDGLGNWVDNFFHANLDVDFDYVQRFARRHARTDTDCREAIVAIGCVDVAVDGLFFPVVSK